MRNTFIKKNKISVMNLLQSLYVAPLPTKMLHAIHDDWNQLKLDACFYPLKWAQVPSDSVTGFVCAHIKLNK